MSTIQKMKVAKKALEISKIHATSTKEIVLVRLDQNRIFPRHTSPADVLLVVLEGSIDFHINDTSTTLKVDQTISFKKNVEHYVVANKDSKFLIIR